MSRVFHASPPTPVKAESAQRRLASLASPWASYGVIAICALGFTFDLADIAFGSALSGVFSAPPYTIPVHELSWLLASNYIGAIAGPLLGGPFADWRGRRIALAVTLLFLAATSVASAYAPGFGALAVIRGFSGVALGAYPPLMITYLSDVLPARSRGRLIIATCALAYIGPPGMIFLMRWLTRLHPLGFEGWRWVLLIVGVGAFAAGGLAFKLPESISWRRGAGAARPDPAQGRPAHPRTAWPRRETALLGALSFLAPWATVSFPLLSAAILIAKGFNLSDTLLYVGISTFGPFLGTALAASVADRLTRRTSLIVCSLGMMGAALAFYLSSNPFWLMLSGFSFNLFVSLYMPALNVYVAEFFPASSRARATSWAWAANRVSAAAVPLLLLPRLRDSGLGFVFAFIIASLVAATVLVTVYGPPGKAGLPVD